MGISDEVMENCNGLKHKGKHDKPKPWDDPTIDHWKIDKFDPSWNEGGLLEISSFSTLFPEYRVYKLRLPLQFWTHQHHTKTPSLLFSSLPAVLNSREFFKFFLSSSSQSSISRESTVHRSSPKQLYIVLVLLLSTAVSWETDAGEILKHTETYLQEVWPIVKSALKEHGISCELNLVEGSMTVSTTRKTMDSYIIMKARDLIKLLSRSVPAPQAIKILKDEMQCDIIKIGNIVTNKLSYAGVKRRQGLVGSNSSTLRVYWRF